MNKIKPTDDFYLSVNEQWLKENTIPEGYSSWGNFYVLRKKSQDALQQIIEELSKNNNNNVENQAIVNLYNNYLNSDARNKDGINPIIKGLEMIDSLKDKNELTDLALKLWNEYNFRVFTNLETESYFNDSNVKALYFQAISLGMSQRDFYEPAHPRHEQIKIAYQKYIHDVAKASKINFKSNDLFGLIYNFENELAKVMLSEVERRDPSKTLNEKSLDEVSEMINFIDLKKYLNVTGYNKAPHFVVKEIKFYERISDLINEMRLDDLKDLLKFNLLNEHASYLSIDLYDIKFGYESIFSGVKTPKPATTRATELVDAYLGELLSREYIKNNFSENAKKDVLRIVNLLIKKIQTRITNLVWMGEETKSKAIEKLQAITIKIGYPDKWNDFSDLDVKSYEQNSSLIANMINIEKHFINKRIREINEPVDRDEWHMFAQTVNAYYSPQTNEICFPAGILQAPFYDEHAKLATNLGGIGAVIGHEIGHGFDDQGSQYDKDGNFNDWWTKEDHEQYKLRTAKLAKQYDDYTVNGNHVNGALTLGENIGDLTGVSVSVDILKDESPEDMKLLFENYARIWANLITDELANTLLATDPHSPGIYRTNGAVINVAEFHETYQTKPGDKMYKAKEDLIKIW